MSARRFLLSLALIPMLASPAIARATPADRSGVPPHRTSFDLQAHRGGIGLTTEESLAGFGKAMRLGVSTLELDTQITEDHKVVVNHDRQVSAQKCRDTAPVTPWDPMYPYVGKYIKDLTLAQIRTMDCGYRQLPGFPEQEEGLAVGRELDRRRPLHQGRERLSRVEVDALHVERVVGPDLVSVHDPAEHLRSVGRTEGRESRVGARVVDHVALRSPDTK